MQQWADITLAAKEQRGRSFFKKTRKRSLSTAFVKQPRANGRRLIGGGVFKKEREQMVMSPLARRLVATCDPSKLQSDGAFLSYLKGEGRAMFEQLTRQAIEDLTRGGMCHKEAVERAARPLHDHLKRRLKHPG